MLLVANFGAVIAAGARVGVACDWLSGFGWVHWTGRDFALALSWHVVRVDLRFCVRSVCPAAGCGAGGVGVILLWIGRLCGLELPLWTNALEAPHW